MRKAIGNVLASALLATGVAGCNSQSATGKKSYLPSEADIAASQAVMSSSQETHLRRTYNRVKAFWAGGLTAKLVLLQGNDTYTCAKYPSGLEVVGDSRSAPQYCIAADTIAITGVFVAHQNPAWADHQPNLEKAGLTFVVAHEAAHGWQIKTAGIRELGNRQETIALELETDCLAGEYVSESGYYSDDQINDIADYILRMPVAEGDNNTHGTSDQRHDSYVHGVQTGQC